MYDYAEEVVKPQCEWDVSQGFDGEHLRLTDLILGTKCRSHGCSNSIKWGLHRQCTESLLDNLDLAISALMNCSDDIDGRLEAFLWSSTVYADPRLVP